MLQTDMPFDLTLLATAVQATSMSFIITDHTSTDHPIIFCNDAFERMTGYSREEILGHNCRFLQRDDRDQPALDIIRKALRHGEDLTITLRNYRKDGSAFRNELVLSPVQDEDGKVTHFIGIQRDLTVVPPQHDLADQFYHEWRTPLTVIKSTLQILQQRGMSLEPEFLNKSLKAAIAAIDRLASLGIGEAPKKVK
uniref:Putative LOV domain-containing protein n=1 Tax=Blasia sp. BC-2016 TaxID=1799561 RepID=A0A126WUK8_9MARC|nr:putative LOV domain-containing protein [Blasia sp. BC-2016]